MNLVNLKDKLVCLTVTILIMYRLFLMAMFYGGIEHDSGWYLGTAINFSKKLIYASLTNTSTTAKFGVNQSIHNRPTINDEEGNEYFYPGVTVGPGYIFPQALLLKLFGYGFWQYRLWPQIATFLIIFLSVYLLRLYSGWLAVLIFFNWHWFMPRLMIGQSFESFSEVISGLFLILPVYFVYKYSENSPKFYIYTGLSFAFAFLTKTITGVCILSSGALLIYSFYFKNKSFTLMSLVKNIFILVTSFLLPVLAFELYRFLDIYYRFGIDGYVANNVAIKKVFTEHGSGLNNSSFDVNFFIKKFEVWADVGIYFPKIFFIIMLLISLYHVLKKKSNLVDLLALFFISHSVWYLFLSSTGWFRHAWYLVYFGIILISIVLSDYLNKITKTVNKFLALGILLFIFIFSFIYTGKSDFSFLINKEEIDQWNSTRYMPRGIDNTPTHPIYSLNDQKEVELYFQKNITDKDHVYYIPGFLVCEISAITKKIFYPVNQLSQRYFSSSSSSNNYIILGPFQYGKNPWRFLDDKYAIQIRQNLCGDMFGALSNSSYFICKAKKVL